MTLPQRFWDKVEKTKECWLWTGSRNDDGYGRYNHDGRNRRAHRVAWEDEYGPIPPGLSLAHTCDTPSCVRTSHLVLATQRENMQDAVTRGRTARRDSGHGTTRVTPRGATVIRAMYASGQWSYARIGAYLGLHERTVGYIVKGDSL